VTEPADAPPIESRTLARLRTILMATLVLGMVGTAVELWLLDHTEGWQQLIPLLLIGAGLLACASHLARPTLGTVRLLQAVMVLFVVSGGVGVLLHYQGNLEFELEMYPEMAGMELFKNTMTGAFPVLAPGTMLLLGLVGLAYTYHYPRIRPRSLDWMDE
jgi:hypothetical protein